MGGDRAPGVIIDGALQAARRLGVNVLLVGPADRLAEELSRRDAASPCTAVAAIVDAPDFVAMDEAPLAAMRRKPRSSIRVAADLVARGEAVGVFQRRALRRGVSGGACGLRDAARRRPARARGDRSYAHRNLAAARRGRDARVPSRPSRPICRTGLRLRPAVDVHRAASRRPSLDWRRSGEGQRPHSRDARAAARTAARVHRQHRAARPLHRQSRRRRL